MKDASGKLRDWVLAFAVLGLLLAILGYGCFHVMVDRAERAVREEYERDITALLMERLLPGEPVSIAIHDPQLGSLIFTDAEEVAALTDLIRSIEWKWSGRVESPGAAPPAGFAMKIELDFGREKSELTLPSVAINGRLYDGFIEGENALNVLSAAIQK